jgi:hypothetical protein
LLGESLDEVMVVGGDHPEVGGGQLFYCNRFASRVTG